ncbi:MAG: hypothetical protein KZY76_07935 [Bacillus sp. (in: Bacteria)]|uniref:hypothetical protein n=1 Tax=Bacillus TaxID=1386 RepID=UPI00227CC7A1|nr:MULTISPECIES: hypothetical protein [Bacillus]MBW4885559.1 hypothetical protein [Bacillus sp. (in: firmicutes)]WAJ16579.1 hypothetical protein OU809_07420 [Bacillus paralicheniformis]
MTIRLNINDLHALARQFRYSHQRISDLINLLNRHFHVLFSSVKAARTYGIDQAQSEMEHELNGFLHTLDDLQHLLHFTEIRMKKTDQMLAEKLLQSGGRLAGYLPIMSFLAAAKCSPDSYRLTAPPLSEPLALMKQIKQNGLSGLFTKKRAAAYIQLDEEGQQQLWSARRMISRTIADNLCLLAYQQIAKGPLSLTVFLFGKKAEADAADIKIVCLSKNKTISAATLHSFSAKMYSG